MMQWYGFFGVLAEVVEEFQTFPAHGLALFAHGFWTLFLPAPCIWLALDPSVYAPVYGGSWKNFSFICVVIAPEPSAHGNLDITSNTWLDSGYMFLGVIFQACSMEKEARSMLQLRGLSELMALGIWTLFHQTLVSDRHVVAVSRLRDEGGHFSILFSSIFRTRPLGVESQVVVPIDAPSELNARVRNNQQPTTNSQQPTANRQPPTANRQPPTANRQPPTANRQPPTANRQPPTANHQPPTTNHQPPTTNHQPPTTNHQPPTTNQQPTNQQPTTNNQQQQHCALWSGSSRLSEPMGIG